MPRKLLTRHSLRAAKKTARRTIRNVPGSRFDVARPLSYNERMLVRYTAPCDIPALLAEHLAAKAPCTEPPLFVFSSDIAADTWSEWAVRNPEQSGVAAVAMDAFTAWDKFKGRYLAGRIADRVCVPSLLRKLFVRDLIRLNLKERFIRKIIPSDDAETAYAFTDWLAKILPSLELWHKKYAAYLARNSLTEETDSDQENRDYKQLYVRYSNFLQKNNFFEPSWLTPEFIEHERSIVIFYPELLEDFCEYEAVLESARNVTAVRLPECGAKPAVRKYPDARSEMRNLLLRLRSLHNQGVRWTDIAVSVPNLETYRPYLRREFARHCIPVNVRSGEPLTKNCAGLIFAQINDCYSARFSYGSVRALLQNEYLPWKADVRTVKEQLIREGSRLRALCSHEADENSSVSVDSWIEALGAVSADTRELEFYKALKNEIVRICEAHSFSALHTAWFKFRQRFLDSEEFTGNANRILSRCISELNDIMDIEKRYVAALGLSIDRPFTFFLNELNSKTYRPQELIDGVSVFPYKLSAMARFGHQFIIDASQANLDVPYKRLRFLSGEKRRALLGAEAEDGADASRAFALLYAKDGGHTHFSYAEENFSGFAIAHNALSPVQAPEENLSATDFIKEEREILRDTARASAKITISEWQQKAFAQWAARTSGFEAQAERSAAAVLMQRIDAFLKGRRHCDGAITLTQTDLARFYPCPRKWILSSVLNLHEDTLDTSLMQTFDMGNINHKILELYMSSLAGAGAALPVTNAAGMFDDEDAVRKSVASCTNDAIHSSAMDFANSPLVLRALESQSAAIADGIMDFLHYLCAAPQKPETPAHNTAIKGFGGYKVQGAELKISTLHKKTGVRLYGKIDCLLSNDDGDYVLIDYKNTPASLPKSAALNEDENGLLGDFQMPMYITLVKDELIGKKSPRIEAAYFYSIKGRKRLAVIDEYAGLSKDKAAAGMENPRHYKTFCDNTLRLFDDYVQDFARRIADGNLEPVVPRKKEGALVHTEPHSVCASCDFRSICRTTFTVGARELRKER